MRDFLCLEKICPAVGVGVYCEEEIQSVKGPVVMPIPEW